MSERLDRALDHYRLLGRVGTCAHCGREQALGDDVDRLVLAHSHAPLRSVCKGSGWSCVEDVDRAIDNALTNEQLEQLEHSDTMTRLATDMDRLWLSRLIAEVRARRSRDPA